jgi:hypothetical protein
MSHKNSMRLTKQRAITYLVMAPKILPGIAVLIRHHPPVFHRSLTPIQPARMELQDCSTPLNQSN